MTLIRRKNRQNRHTGSCLPSLVFLLLTLYALPLVAAGYDLKSEVDGQKRTARVFESSDRSGEPVPLVLAFHGYADNRMDFSRFVDLHKAWPDAIVVYPEGLKIPDREGKLRSRGWQTRAGSLGDRDLSYVDYLLEEMQKRYSVDPRRVYASGFSNGARLVFLLMGQRPDKFAAFAPVGATVSGQVLKDLVVPGPVMYILGKEEIAGRVEAAQLTVEAISKNNRSSREQAAWAEDYVHFKPATGGADFIFNLHKGGHVWPYVASERISRFFRQHPMPDSEEQ